MAKTNSQTGGSAFAPGQSWLPLLQAVPIPNEAIRVRPDTEPDTLSVAIDLKPPGWLIPPLSWIFPTRRERVVRLDRLGTQVWRWCDGHRTVQTMVERLANDETLTFHEARVAITQYLQQLVQRGVVVLAVSEGGNHR